MGTLERVLLVVIVMLVAVILMLVLCPPKYDPVIRLKEYFDLRRQQRAQKALQNKEETK